MFCLKIIDRNQITVAVSRGEHEAIFAPAPASASAIAKPIPYAAPVTRATLPSNEKRFFISIFLILLILNLCYLRHPYHQNPGFGSFLPQKYSGSFQFIDCFHKEIICIIHGKMMIWAVICPCTVLNNRIAVPAPVCTCLINGF